MVDDCSICRKHVGEGPLVAPVIWSDDVIVVTHIPPVGDETTAFVGHLVIETRRHAPHLDDLTEDEAAAVGRVVRVAARALRTEFQPEYVFSGMIGVGVAHFHQHVWPQHPGTPERYAWHSVDEWPGAPRAAGADLQAVCDRLRPPIIPGDGPYGTRIVGCVDHGRAVGGRVYGEFVGAGADWMLVGKDGYGRIDVRGQIMTDDEAAVDVQYQGLLELNEISTAALLEVGKETTWDDQYFRTTPRFETGDSRYAWMNEAVFVARGRVTTDGIEYEVFRVC